MDNNNANSENNNNIPSQSTEIENPLSEEKIEEFKSYLVSLDKKIEERYGTIRLQERLNVERYKIIIAGMGKCKVEGMLKILENKTRKIIQVNKFSNIEPSGEDAHACFNVELNDRLKIPWLRRVNLFDFPFQIVTREKENKKCVDLNHTFNHFKYTATLRLIIREINL